MSSKAYQKAIQLLARRAHSRAEIRRKLKGKFAEREIVLVLEKLEERGYLNDTQFALMRSRSLRTRKNWGKLRIIHDLQKLGVDAKIIRSTLVQLEEASPENEGLGRAVDGWKRIKGDPKTAPKLKKLYNHCLRLGYSPELIRKSLDKDFQTVDWNTQ